MLEFTGERIVPEASNCEPLFARKMYQEHAARYLFASQLCIDRHVLDVGCGVGYGSKLLVEHGAKHVTAFDASEQAIKHAKELYSDDAIEFHVASAHNFSFEKKFEVAVCFELIEHVTFQEGVVQRISSALVHDGILFISTPRALAEGRSEFHTREFSFDDFRRLLEKSFRHVCFFYENNHFSSLITSSRPSQLTRIEVLENQFSPDQADYFICVASQTGSAPLLRTPD